MVAEHEECCEHSTQEVVKIQIKECVTWNGVEQGMGVPYQVDGHVMHSRLEKQFDDHHGK